MVKCLFHPSTNMLSNLHVVLQKTLGNLRMKAPGFFSAVVEEPPNSIAHTLNHKQSSVGGNFRSETCVESRDISHAAVDGEEDSALSPAGSTNLRMNSEQALFDNDLPFLAGWLHCWQAKLTHEGWEVISDLVGTIGLRITILHHSWFTAGAGDLHVWCPSGRFVAQHVGHGMNGPRGVDHAPVQMSNFRNWNPWAGSSDSRMDLGVWTTHQSRWAISETETLGWF